MFDRGKGRRSGRQAPYGEVPGLGNAAEPAREPIRRAAPINRDGGPDIDQYMYRSIMGTAERPTGKDADRPGGASSGFETRSESGPDSVTLRLDLPVARAEQLRALARDLDESPQTLARLWVMERLRELSDNRTAGNKSNGGSAQESTKPSVLELPAVAGQASPPDPVAALKRQLGDQYVTDPEERTMYNDTYAFRQWGPYLAGLVLSTRGRKMFTLDDMRHLLRDELMPGAYDTAGALDRDLVLRDVELGRPGDQLRPYACLERVSPGVYSFLGFRRARTMRAAR
ncbi:MAG: hypothetical protein M0R22_08765 [Dehalococcoidia bacterium]|jgi:hypothetical protein|nr:hypothetical protein [Dehalococcoidia bacterium]